MLGNMDSGEQHARALLAQAGIELGGKRPWDIRVLDTTLYRDVFWRGSLALGDGYTDHRFECDKVDEAIDRILRSKLDQGIGKWGTLFLRLAHRSFNLQSVRRSTEVGRRHYDLGNRLYELMLGESMSYSSGYFRGGALTLLAAQHAKFDRICRKLNLRSGMRVLEIGAGFGSFAEYAAKNYGVSVVGISISKEQIAYATKRCEGLPVEIRFADYRTLGVEHEGAYDAVVAIEMIEAVGERNLRGFMSVIARSLKPGALACIQAIIGDGGFDAWISTRIFPNGILPSIAGLAKASKGILRQKHYESFGEDYDKTLMEWHKKFIGAWDEIRQLTDEKGALLYDESFRRMWEFYLLLCAGSFRSGAIDVSQIVYARDAENVTVGSC